MRRRAARPSRTGVGPGRRTGGPAESTHKAGAPRAAVLSCQPRSRRWGRRNRKSPCPPCCRRRPRGVARILGRLHRPRPEPHVGQVPGCDAGHLRHAEGGLPREVGGDRPGQRHLRHGGGGPPVRHRPQDADHPQRLVQLPLDADPGDGEHRRVVDGAQGPPDRPRPPDALRAGAGRRGGGHHPRDAPRGRLRAARRDLRRHDAARRLPAPRERCGARGGRPVRARLHRLRHDLGRHGSHRRRPAHQRAAEGLERLSVLRLRDAERAARASGSTPPPAPATPATCASGCRSWRPTKAVATRTTPHCPPTR